MLLPNIVKHSCILSELCLDQNIEVHRGIVFMKALRRSQIKSHMIIHSRLVRIVEGRRRAQCPIHARRVNHHIGQMIVWLMTGH